MIPMSKTVIIIDYKIIYMRTFGLSMQNKGPAIARLQARSAKARNVRKTDIPLERPRKRYGF